VRDPIELGNPNSAPAIQRAIEEMTAFTLGVPKTLDGSGYSAQSGAKVDLLKGSYVHGQKGGPSSAPSDEFCRVVTSRCKATCDALIGPLQAKRDQNGSLPSAQDCKSGCDRTVVPAGCPDLNH